MKQNVVKKVLEVVEFEADQSKLNFKIFDSNLNRDVNETISWCYYEDDQAISSYDLYFDDELLCSVWISPGNSWKCNCHVLIQESSNNPTDLMKKVEEIIFNKFKNKI